MKYSVDEVMQFVDEEDVKFIRLAFCDVYGKQKNISIQPGELQRAFKYGIAFDASSVKGFGDEARSDLFLHPEADTLAVLPWRPEHGRVVRMFCDITRPDGKSFEGDTRQFLKRAVEAAKKEGLNFMFGLEPEFYLFQLDENGKPTNLPYDEAGYMDIAPEDKGENIRREICITLEQMGITPESSHHEGGPGQNEIDFKYSDPISAADNTATFMTAVKTVANRNGLYADFSPKPIDGAPGNGMHINFSVTDKNNADLTEPAIAGVLKNIPYMTAFLNSSEDSYKRLGNNKAPRYISWSAENRSQLIRIPAAFGDFKRAELRSPDPGTNVYIACALIIYAAIFGILDNLQLPPAVDINLFKANADALNKLDKLPCDLSEAKELALNSDFIRGCVPQALIDAYLRD